MPYIPAADYARMLVSLEADDNVSWCQECGAFLYQDEKCTVDDFDGCWFAAIGQEKYRASCKRHRAKIAQEDQR